MGIKSSMEEEPSLALGSSDVNLLELANAYSTIANQESTMNPYLLHTLSTNTAMRCTTLLPTSIRSFH